MILCKITQCANRQAPKYDNQRSWEGIQTLYTYIVLNIGGVLRPPCKHKILPTHLSKHKISPSLKRGDIIYLFPRWVIQAYKVPSKYTKKFLQMLYTIQFVVEAMDSPNHGLQVVAHFLLAITYKAIRWPTLLLACGDMYTY